LCRSTPAVGAEPVGEAIRNAWLCGRRYWTELARRHNRLVPHGLFTEIDGALWPRGA
jgi:hypothetical protein